MKALKTGVWAGLALTILACVQGQPRPRHAVRPAPHSAARPGRAAADESTTGTADRLASLHKHRSLPAIPTGIHCTTPTESPMAPAFELPDVSGRLYSLARWNGRPVVLNFWAFWCNTWEAELPYLKTLAGRQHSMGFGLVAISVDGMRVAVFHQHVKEPLPFPVLLDVGRWVSQSYGVSHVPTVVVLDSAGRVRFTASGYPGNARILSELRSLEAEEAGRPGKQSGQ